MYPIVRVEKHVPGGSVWQRFRGYRLPDVDAVARVYTPIGTRWWNPLGGWAQEHRGLSAFAAGRPFVVHCYGPAGAKRFYIDIVRSSDVGSDTITYLDLYLDVMIDPDRAVTEKDEHQLGALSPVERAAVRAARDEVRAGIAAGAALFDPASRFFAVPTDAEALPPLAA